MVYADEGSGGNFLETEAANQQVLKICFWGSRGSSPVVISHEGMLETLQKLVAKAQALGVKKLDEFVQAALSGRLGHPLSYGGHTPCTQVSFAGQDYLVDMGSGLRQAGPRLAKNTNEFHIFMTHMHWDHLIGLNFFAPIFTPGNKLNFYHVHKNAPESVRMMFNGVNFPVKWEQLQAQIEFKQLRLYTPTVFDNGMQVTPFALDHPGGSFGYRFDAAGKSLVVGFDGEYTRISREELGKDLPYYQNLDLLVFDAQYELEELADKNDWGHSSAPIGIDLALREGIKNLVLIHHDPWASDDRLRKSLAKAQQYCRHNLVHHDDVWPPGSEGPKIISAYDGLRLVV